MLQRIQTVWLLLASIASFLTLSSNISFFSGNKLVNNVKSFVYLYAKENNLVLVITVIIAVAALVLIFMYKDRKMQLRLSFTLLLLSILNIVLYFLQTKQYVPNEGRLDITVAVYFLIPVFLVLAIRNIWKDQKLVKSVDRLR